MKQNLCISLLCLALLLPSCPAWVEEAVVDAETPTEQSAAGIGAQQNSAAPAKGQTVTIGGHSLSWWINHVIGSISQIGAIFRKTTGFRIGETTGTALLTLVAAKLLHDKAPSWVKWLLYLSGDTMAVGDGANILQLLTRQFLG
ncbi:MAG: hypothetical protein LBI86_06560 [Treponema sp.]|jgi:hypothetical protein|nr:hypothetical protein [Treponema sp.]